MEAKTVSSESGGIYRTYESSAINLISAYPKVLQILKGEIPTPEVVEIFPTNFCNFECPHCRFEDYHGDGTTYMGLDALEGLLKELRQRDVNAIELSGGGEPLMHPQIEELFEKLIEGNFRVGLITNGYCFINSDRLKEQALQCCNWIRFSVDAFTNKTFQVVHGRRGISYSQLKKVISELVKAKKGILRIETKMLISKLNVHECEHGVEEAVALGVDCFQLKFLGNHKYELTDEEMFEVKEKIQNLIDRFRDKPVRVELIPPYRGEKTYQKCLMTFLHPVVDWDGEIYVCAFFEHRKKKHSLGNIHNGGFFKHWNSPRHKEVFDLIDPSTCIPKCPMLRYNPVIDFIKSDAYRFPFV